MKLDDFKSLKPVILVLGKLCSGKGQYCRTHFPDRKQIIVSDIVRRLSGKTKRKDLQKTRNLDQQIADEIIEQLDGEVVVDGIRQMSIVRRVMDAVGEKNVDIIWLDVPEEELKRRYTERGAEKDTGSFAHAEFQDRMLGLGDVERWAKENPQTKIVRN